MNESQKLAISDVVELGCVEIRSVGLEVQSKIEGGRIVCLRKQYTREGQDKEQYKECAWDFIATTCRRGGSPVPAIFMRSPEELGHSVEMSLSSRTVQKLVDLVALDVQELKDLTEKEFVHCREFLRDTASATLARAAYNCEVPNLVVSDNNGATFKLNGLELNINSYHTTVRATVDLRHPVAHEAHALLRCLNQAMDPEIRPNAVGWVQFSIDLPRDPTVEDFETFINCAKNFPRKG